MMRWLIEFAKDVHAKRRHEWHEEMDLITSGQHGYWKRDPYWPRKPAALGKDASDDRSSGSSEGECVQDTLPSSDMGKGE